MAKSWWVHLTVLAQLDSCNVAHACLLFYLTDAHLAMELFMDGGDVVQECRSLPHWISSEWDLESITALVEGAHLHTGQVFQRVHAFSPPGRRTSRVLMQKEAVMVVLELTSQHCKIQERFCICQSLVVHASVHAPLVHPHQLAEMRAGRAHDDTKRTLRMEVCPHGGTAIDIAQIHTLFQVERHPWLKTMMARTLRQARR